MLHKHPSAEKAQSYFGISEKVKHDSANFFIYIQPKLGNIYDNSIARALDEHFFSQFIRDQHLSHLSALLAGGIDHSFIEEARAIWLKYSSHGVTIGEYIKLYQLVISYLSGEAHRKHWWRYKKYRDLNRAIHNLLLFDLAVGTSLNDGSLESHASKNLSQPVPKSATLFISADELQRTIDELTDLAQRSYDALQQGHTTIQEILESLTTLPPYTLSKENNEISEKLALNSHLKQESLFDYDAEIETHKLATNENKPAFLELVSQTHQKVQNISTLLLNASGTAPKVKEGDLERMIQEVEHDIKKVIKNLIQTNIPLQVKDDLSKVDTQTELYQLLHKSSKTIKGYLDRMADFKERKL